MNSDGLDKLGRMDVRRPVRDDCKRVALCSRSVLLAQFVRYVCRWTVFDGSLN